jgi:hypothetical protein
MLNHRLALRLNPIQANLTIHIAKSWRNQNKGPDSSGLLRNGSIWRP